MTELLETQQRIRQARCVDVIATSPWPRRYFLITALIPGHLLSWAVEWGVAGLTTMLGALLYPKFHRRYPAVSSVGIFLVALVTLISAFSYLVTLSTGRFATGPRDWVDLLRPFIVYLSCALGFVFGSISLSELRRLCRYVLLVTAIATIALVISLPVLSPLVDVVYGSTKTGISESLVRISIPFENPNFLGLFSVAALCCALLFGKRPDFLLALLALLAIALTGSRTAWVTAIIVALVYLAGTASQILGSGSGGRQISRSWVLTISVVALVLLVRFLPAIAEMNQRFSDFLQGLATLELLSEPAYVARQEMRAEAWRLIGERLFIGWGALKQSEIDIVDNQYVSVLLRGGIFGGLVVIIGLSALFRRHLARAAKEHARVAVYTLWIITLAWMWNGSFAENVRLSVLLSIMFASSVTLHGES